MSSASKALLETLSSVLKHGHIRNGFDHVLKDVKILSAVPGKVDFEMEVKHEHTNQGNILHGGLTSTLIDTLTTLALMSTERQTPGVSVDLGINFLKAAKLGDKIKIETEVIKQGKTLAFTMAKILNQKGEIVALGNHVKHIGG
ncbi:acyl-coenzyme A thioesterase 13-like [Apostichopus japonicus]|uniref:acyl-coenzyme A thioesterase 13-like n=1 Tax=Stichopus japonicus TaxID=307972 RepID=UPI003AB4BE95